MNLFFTAIARAADCPEGELCNPLNTTDLIVLVKNIMGYITKLAIPIAVIIIIWIGIKFFLAQGNPEKINQASKALLWTIVGFAIILIGDGFIALIQSVLNLGK